MNADLRCRWHDEYPCEFKAELKTPIKEFNGRHYCTFHMPIDSPLRRPWTGEQFRTAVADNQVDLRGVQFLPGQLTFPSYRGRQWDLSGCSFPRGAATNLNGLGFKFDRCVFGDPTRENDPRVLKFAFTWDNDCSVHLTGSTAHCRIEMNTSENAPTGCSWSLADSTFFHQVNFRDMKFSESLSLDRATFHDLTDFEGAEFPQLTTARGLRFLGKAISPEAEGSFRAARVSFGDQRNRELEGRFYAYEKRCHRLSLVGWRSLVPRILSTLYHWTAQYGQSYGFALLWFFGVQLLFALTYSLMAGRFQIPGPVDGAVWTFTLAQVAKPFELLSARPPLSSAYGQVVGTDPSGWWIVATVAHSVASLILLALAVLAIRWRFKRE